MHTGVVSPDITMRSIQRTVQNPDILICDRRFHTGLCKGRCRRKYDITSILDCLTYHVFYCLRRDIIIIHGRNFVRERLLQMQSSKLMGICPCGR